MQITTTTIARRLWDTYMTATRRETDEASNEYRSATPPESADRRATIVLITSVVVLLITNFGTDWKWIAGIGGFLGAGGVESLFTTADAAQFNRLAWWAVVQISAYVALPLLAIRYGLGGKPVDFGAGGSLKHAGVYIGLLAVSIPLIVAVSFTDGFQAKYPFYDLTPGQPFWPYLWIWWVLYGLQFVALEFFFRGFMVHGLKHRFGYMAVVIMVVPYTMIHFRKPLLEAIGAIFGGTILGTMSLKTRSVWWGAALHVTIAGTMDVLSLAHKGLI
ncbi:MAG TPA: CPBP family intramembrane glutamic endopeptidase [Acidimicrobiia bacterium]|nr:CPBP family intramembrane glutamic endopeptidase [Acidimicrobiia bacterium]